jgi:hypothetical protein
MGSKLELDRYYITSKKDLEGRGGFLDRRKFRAQLSEYEKTVRTISETLEKVGLGMDTALAASLMKIKNIYQLNKLMVCLVYKYYQEKKFSLENVVKDFDKDFEEVLSFYMTIKNESKLRNKGTVYRFRQDFIIYLFRIDDFYQKELYVDDEEYYVDPNLEVEETSQFYAHSGDPYYPDEGEDPE